MNRQTYNICIGNKQKRILILHVNKSYFPLPQGWLFTDDLRFYAFFLNAYILSANTSFWIKKLRHEKN